MSFSVVHDEESWEKEAREGLKEAIAEERSKELDSRSFLERVFGTVREPKRWWFFYTRWVSGLDIWTKSFLGHGHLWFMFSVSRLSRKCVKNYIAWDGTVGFKLVVFPLYISACMIW